MNILAGRRNRLGLKVMKACPLSLLQFGILLLLVLVVGIAMYSKVDCDYLFTDFVVKEPYVCEVKYRDSIWLSDLYVSFGDGRFCLMHDVLGGEDYTLNDRKHQKNLLQRIVRGEQRKNIIRLWDKDGKEHIFDFLVPTLDGRCIECGKIHLGGVPVCQIECVPSR